MLVVGDGVIGLSAALAVARAGGSCRVIGRTIDGRASAAAAGLLAPSLGNADEAARTLMRVGRDLYPSWVHWLAERTGMEITLNLLGILELDLMEGAPAPEAAPPNSDDALLLGRTQLRSLEPALGSAAHALLHQGDGYVDTAMLLSALREAVRCEWSIDVVQGRAASVDVAADGCSVTTEDGRSLKGESLVLAAGAWTPLIAGLPRHVPIEPVRGQILVLDGCPLSRAVASADAYLVPRRDRTLVGSTLERVGFDNRTTPAALEHLRRAAAAVTPELASAAAVDSWAGLRPMTPDGLPILGHDPEFPRLVYACGHGKNGILLAPLTADCVSAIVASSPPPYDITILSIDRFD